MERTCKIHGLTRHNVRTEGGYRCGKCASAAVDKRRKATKQKAVEYKGGICAHCEHQYPYPVFEFHHEDPGLKDFAISGGGHCRSWSAIQAELDKCLMLCANCHRIEHARLGC